MQQAPSALDDLDRRITAWMAGHGVTLLRLSVGLVFFWFGNLRW